MRGPYYVEVHSLYTHFVESFYHKRMLSFVKCFFFFAPIDVSFLALILLNYIDDIKKKNMTYQMEILSWLKLKYLEHIQHIKKSSWEK